MHSLPRNPNTNFLSLVNLSLAKFYSSTILSNHSLIKLERSSPEFITVCVIIISLLYLTNTPCMYLNIPCDGWNVFNVWELNRADSQFRLGRFRHNFICVFFFSFGGTWAAYVGGSTYTLQGVVVYHAHHLVSSFVRVIDIHGPCILLHVIHDHL
jgi:hypothetical protein